MTESLTHTVHLLRKGCLTSTDSHTRGCSFLVEILDYLFDLSDRIIFLTYLAEELELVLRIFQCQ